MTASLPGKDELTKSIVAGIMHNDPHGVLGPWILAVVLDSLFMGLLWTQIINYFTWFPRDSPWRKGLVGAAAVLSLLKSAQTLYITWNKFVDGFGDWINMVDIPWIFYTSPLFSQISNCIAQIFFAWRCFVVMNRNYYLLGGLCTTITAGMALGCVVCYVYSQEPYNNDRIMAFSIPQLTFNIVTDLTISVIVSIKLLRSRSGFSATTDTVLNKLLRVTWSAGIPPTVSAVLDMVTFVTMPMTLWHVMFNMLTSRLYVFSMMYALNSRATIREILAHTPGFTDEFSAPPAHSSGVPMSKRSVVTGGGRRPNNLTGITVDTEVAVDYRDSFVVEAYLPGHRPGEGGGDKTAASSDDDIAKDPLPPV